VIGVLVGEEQYALCARRGALFDQRREAAKPAALVTVGMYNSKARCLGRLEVEPLGAPELRQDSVAQGQAADCGGGTQQKVSPTHAFTGFFNYVRFAHKGFLLSMTVSTNFLLSALLLRVTPSFVLFRPELHLLTVK
jgi:hypothetical protein